MSRRNLARLLGALLAFIVLWCVPCPLLKADRRRAVWASGGPGWSTPENVSASILLDSEAPTVAVSGSGVVHAVWEEGKRLYHASRDGGSWSSPSSILGTINAQQPVLASGSGDEIHLVFANRPDVFYSSWNGTSWSAPLNLSLTTSTSDEPDLAVAGDGSLHVVTVEGSNQHLYYASVGDGSYVPIPGAYGTSPSIDVTAAGPVEVHVAYREFFPATTYDISYTSRGPAGSWSLPEVVSNSPEDFSTAPQLALGAGGVPHVAWRETISATPQVQYARGTTWTPIITLSQSATGTTLPAFAVDALGGQHAAWGDGTSPSFALLHTSRTAALSWSGPTAVNASILEIQDVVLDADPRGPIHAVWVEGDNGEVWYARWSPHQVFLPLIYEE